MQMEVRTLARTGATKARYVWLMILAATVILFGATAYAQQNLSGQQNSQSGQQKPVQSAKLVRSARPVRDQQRAHQSCVQCLVNVHGVRPILFGRQH